MPSFGTTSRRRLETADPRLQEVFNIAIQYMDMTILCGERTEVEQNALYAEGKTQVKYPDSKHNKSPSLAVDAAPWPIDWSDREQFTLMAGLIIGIGAMLGYTIRWGGDWNRDFKVSDNNFDDLPHFEIVG